MTMCPDRRASLEKLDDYLEIVDSRVRTSRRLSEVCLRMTNDPNLMSGERLIRDDLNKTFDDFTQNHYEATTTRSEVEAIRDYYWARAQNVSEVAGAYPGATLDDYFVVDVDRDEESVRKMIREKYESGSVPGLLLSSIEAYSTSLNITIMEASRIATKHLTYAMPYLKMYATEHVSTGDFNREDATRAAFHYFADELVPNHIRESERSGSIAKYDSCYPALPADSELLEPLLLSAGDAKALTRVYKLERRPYSHEELRGAAELTQSPMIRSLLMNFQLTMVEYGARYLEDHPERKEHSLLPFSEIFVESDGEFLPNPKLLKVLSNNYLPALAGILAGDNRDVSTLQPEDFANAATDARKRRVFFAQIARYNNHDRENDTVELDAFVSRTCPGMKMLTDSLTHWLPEIYSKMVDSKK